MPLVPLASSIFDLPRIYDHLFEPHPFTQLAVTQWVAEHCTSRPDVVLDPACGTGAWLDFFSPKVALVNDLNPSMVEFSKKKLAYCRVYACVGDMARFAFEGAPSADLAINLAGTVGHIADYKDLERHLECVGNCLSTGGIYLLGAIVPSDARLPPARYSTQKTIDGSLYRLSVTRSIERSGAQELDRMHYTLLCDNGEAHASAKLVDEVFHLSCFGVQTVVDAATAGHLELVAIYHMETPGFPPVKASRAEGDCTIVLRKFSR